MKPQFSRLTLPFWGSIPGGFPSPAQGYEDEPLDLHALLVRRPAATFFMTVRGDHLHRDGIRDGSILVVDRSLTPRTGTLVVADWNGSRSVMRMPAALDGGDSLEVWGVVTGIVTQVKS